MGSVLTLSGANKKTPNESLISALESLLNDAKEGRLQSLVGTGFTGDGMRLALWCDTHEDVYQMLGALAWLQAEYIERHANI